jgi:O-antigen/teichoic acid export membrane protein
MAAGQADLLVLGLLHVEAPVIGAYALAGNLAAKADVVNHSLYAVTLPAASSLRGYQDLRGYVRRSLIRSAAIAVGLALLIPAAGPLVAIFYGPGYAESASLFRVLLGVALFDVVVTPLLLLAYHFNRPGLLAAADMSRVLTLVAVAIALVPVNGAFGMVYARFASRVVGAMVVGVALWRWPTTSA